MINLVVLLGRLCADPELRYTTNGNAVANFTLAVDRGYTGQSSEKETDFIRIVVWRKLAENCANYLTKGQMAAVEGRIQVRNYKVDGQNRQAFEVVANNVRFLGRPRQNDQP